MAQITLVKPLAGMTQNVTPQANDNLVLDFNASDATLSREGDNLVWSFEDGAQVTLVDFYAAYSLDAMPNFMVEGVEISGKDFFSALGEELMPAAGVESTQLLQGSNGVDAVDVALQGGIDSLGRLDQANTASISELSEAHNVIATSTAQAVQNFEAVLQADHEEDVVDNSHVMEVVPPKVSITVKDNGDGVISKNDLGGPTGEQVQVEVTLQEGVEEGDEIVIEQDGNIIFKGPVTEDMLENGVEVWVEPSEDGEMNLEATVTTPDGLTGTDTTTVLVDTTPPTASIELDFVTPDNIINIAESNGFVDVTGSVGGDVKPGDVVTLTIGGQKFSGKVDDNGDFSISVPGSVLAQNSSISASVTTSDEAGNTTTAKTGMGYGVDTEISATITMDSITDDDIINLKESEGDVTITGTVGGDVKPGDTVTITVGSQEYTGTVQEDNTYSIDVPGSELAQNSNVSASVTASDAAGNSTTVDTSVEYKVDTEISATITLDKVTEDNVLNLEESEGYVAITGSVGDDVKPGDTVTLTVNGQEYSGKVDENGEFSIDVPGSELAQDSNVSASVTTSDEAGNTTTATTGMGYGIDTEISASIALDKVTEDNILNLEESEGDVAITGSVGGDVKPGDTVTLTIDGQTFSGKVDDNGGFSIGVPGSVLAQNSSISASVTASDEAGNTTTATTGMGYGVDTEISATITMDSITDDDIINLKESEDDIAITGTVGGDVKPGDTVTITVGGQEYTGTVQEDNTYSIDVPGKELVEHGDAKASVTATDSAGNSVSASVEPDYTTDTSLGSDLTGEVSTDDGNMAQQVVVDGITLDENTSYDFDGAFAVGDADNPFGSFTVTESGELLFTQNESYKHDAKSDGTTMDVQIPVKDSSGNETFVTVTLTVTDSAPEVHAKSDTELTVNDNVASADITVDLGGDMEGATIILEGGGTFDYGVQWDTASGSWQPIEFPPYAWQPPLVETSYEDGVHTITIGDVTMTSTDNENWNVSYTHNDSDRDVTLTFTDGDGDSVSHTMETNDKPTVGEEVRSAEVFESALADGTDAESTSESATGQIELDFGMDGQGTFAWDTAGQPDIVTSDGTKVTWSVEGDVLTGTADGQEVLSVTMQKDGNGNYTGEYTVELQESIKHDAPGKEGDDSSELNFNFTITDADGDSTQGSVGVEIHDDSMNAQDVTVDLAPDMAFSETFFDGSASSSELHDTLMPNKDVNPDFNYNGGGWNVQFYDNQNADKSTMDVGGFTISAAIVKYDAEEGHSVNQNASGLELGWRVDNSTADGTDYANGIGLKGQGGSSDYEIGNREGDYDSGVSTEAIIITLPEGEVAYGVDLSFGCLFQAGENTADTQDETIVIEFFKDGELVYSVEQVRGTTDGDQNFDTSTVTVPFDEIRVIPSAKGSDFVLTDVNFSEYSNVVIGQASGGIEAGADGIADAYFESISVGNSTVDFSLNDDGSVSTHGTLTLEDGTELTLTVKNGVVTAQDNEGTDYFTATVDAEGNWTMYQHEAFGDKLSVEIGTVDSDGDTQNHTITLNGNDAPTVGEASAAQVFEADLADGTNADADVEVATGQVDLDFGSDGEGAFIWDSDNQPSLTTSDGSEITWVSDGTVLRGMAGDEEILTVTMDTSTGEYTVELRESINHAESSENSADLNFGFTIADADGNVAFGQASVEVVDDTVTVNEDATLDVNTGDTATYQAADYFSEGADREGGEYTVLGADAATQGEDGTTTYTFEWGSVQMNTATGEYTIKGNGMGDASMEVQYKDADGDSAIANVAVENSVVIADITIDEVQGFVGNTVIADAVVVTGTIHVVDTTGENNTVEVVLNFLDYESDPIIATRNEDGSYSYTVEIPKGEISATTEFGTNDIEVDLESTITTKVQIVNAETHESLANDSTDFSYSYFDASADVKTITGSEDVDIIEGVLRDDISGENMGSAINLGNSDNVSQDVLVETKGGDDQINFESAGKHAYNMLSEEGDTVTLDTGSGNDELNLHTTGTVHGWQGVVGMKAEIQNGQDGTAHNTIDLGSGDDKMNIVTDGSGYFHFAMAARDKNYDGEDRVSNTIDLGTGNDSLYIKGEIDADSGKNIILGGEGNDTVTLEGADVAAYTSLTEHTLEASGTSGQNLVDLGDGDDVLIIRNDGAYGGGSAEMDVHNKYGDALNAIDGAENTIEMGSGNDNVHIEGDLHAYSQGDNVINMGDGDDVVTIDGNMDATKDSSNTINLGAGDDSISIDGNMNADSTSNNIINAGEGDDVVSVVNFTDSAKAYLDGDIGYDTFEYDNDYDTFMDFSQVGNISIGGAEGVQITNFESVRTGGGDDLFNIGNNTEANIDSGAGFDIVVADGGVTDTDMSEILQNSLNTEMFIFSNDKDVKDSTSTEEALNNLKGVETNDQGEITALGENWTQGESQSHNGMEFQTYTDEGSETTIMIAKTMLENVVS